MLNNWNIRKKLAFGAAVPLLLLVCLGMLGYFSIERMQNTNKWVSHTHKVLAEANKIVSSAVDMETGLRGYLLAGQERFLEPFNRGSQSFEEQVSELQQTVSDNPAQMARLDEARAVIGQWQSDVVQPMIDLRRAIGDAPTMNDMADRVSEARGKTYFDSFREQVATFIEREQVLLDQRIADYASIQSTVKGQMAEATDRRDWVAHTHNVLRMAQNLLAAAIDMETGMRGYLLAGQEEFLEPYRSGHERFFALTATLGTTVSDNPEQVARVSKIEEIVGGWISGVVEPAFVLRREVNRGAKDETDISAYVANKAGKIFFDRFREEIELFATAEDKLLAERKTAATAADGTMVVGLDSMADISNWVTHTYRVIGKINAILAAATDMETGMRGFLLAGRETFLEPFDSGRERFDLMVSELQKTVSDNPPQVELLAEMRDTVHGWLNDVVEPTLELRRMIGDADTMDDVADMVAEANGKVFFDKFRQIMAEFSAEEYQLLALREEGNASASFFAKTGILAGLGMGLLFGVVLAWLTGNAIAQPILRLTNTMADLAANKLDIEVVGTNRKDEIGEMAKAVEVFKVNAVERESMRSKEQQRAAKLDSLILSFDQVAKTNLERFDNANSALTQLAEEISDTVDSSTTSVHSVAAASEELSQSITAISENTSQSRETTLQSVERVESAASSVDELASDLQNIASIAELIGEIAEQTNLLALNATIESARAGDAGKGFAVVASEVKALANRTGQATNDIATKVSQLLAQAKAATGSMQQVRETIAQIEEFTLGIAGAIEEQAATTSEIASSAQSAAESTEIVRNKISRPQDGVEISPDIRTATNDMNHAANGLGTEIKEFLEHVRSA